VVRDSVYQPPQEFFQGVVPFASHSDLFMGRSGGRRWGKGKSRGGKERGGRECKRAGGEGRGRGLGWKKRGEGVG